MTKNSENSNVNENNINRQKIYNKFGEDVLNMIIRAKAASVNSEVDCIYPESFIMAILTGGENLITTTLIENNRDLDKCLKEIRKKLLEYKKLNTTTDTITSFSNLKISKQIADISLDAYNYCVSSNKTNINIEHIFVSTLKLNEYIKKIFDTHFLTTNKNEKITPIEEVITLILNKNKKTALDNDNSSLDKKTSSIINKFCINMTEMARQNKYDPILARDAEIEETITILCRRNKSNPLLIGEAGVGKSAILEGISQRVVSNSVPQKLQGSKIFNLNLTSLVAGTKYRGEFEERMQALIKDIENDPKAIIFIDEIHMIMGAGGASGSMDVANILKPALARNLKCIGSTTYAEYKRYFSEDGALMRRFAPITIEEPNDDQIKIILMGIKHKLESYHECIITDDAIDATINLARRYCQDRHFPDKAIDCLDTACAKCAWVDKDKKSAKPSISSNDIALVISKQCGIPLEVIMWDSFERIKQTEEILTKKIIGQSDAILSICRILKNAYSGVRNPNKPIGILVFGGPSGCGKTYSSKQLAAVMFGSENAYIRIDMSEYSEPHSVSKIIGSPPGYVGFKDIDIVADRIKRKPHCVFLVDEVEKAHPTVMKLFLQIMGEGILTTASGEKVDCHNIILIMTGNFGMNNSFVERPAMGFVTQEKDQLNNNSENKKRVIKYFTDSFGPEFVNRVDDFIPFVSLSEDNLIEITKLKLEEFLLRINNKKISIKFEENIATKIVKMTKEEHGLNAMSIERVISKNLEPCIADTILAIKDHKKEYIINVSYTDKFISVLS